MRDEIDYDYHVPGNGPYMLGAVTPIDVNTFKNGSDSAVPDYQTTNDYAWYDTAVQSAPHFRPDMGSSTTYHSTFTLSPSGTLNSVYINDGRARTVSFKTDMDGQVVRRDEGDIYSSKGDPHAVRYRFGITVTELR